MKLHAPFEISPSLEPGLQIGGAWLCLTYSRRPGRSGRTRFDWRLILPGAPEDFTGDDLQSGCGGGGLQEAFGSLLAFLGAAAESFRYRGLDGENADLFPPPVVEWAAGHSDEIDMLRLEIAESEEALIEE